MYQMLENLVLKLQTRSLSPGILSDRLLIYYLLMLAEAGVGELQRQLQKLPELLLGHGLHHFLTQHVIDLHSFWEIYLILLH